MTNDDNDYNYVAKAYELARSGKFKTYTDVDAQLVLLGVPPLKAEQPGLAFEIESLCNKARSAPVAADSSS